VAGRGADRIGAQLNQAPQPHSFAPAGADATARRFARAILDRDPRAAATCFSDHGRILTADGTEVFGHEGILGVLDQITSSAQSLDIRVGRTIVAETVASCTQFWRRGQPDRRFDHGTEATVARLVLLKSGPRWEILIASPWE
jgi:hypothetical protein